MTPRRGSRLAPVALALGMLLAGCSTGDDAPQVPDPAAAVQALADALGTGDPAGVPWRGGEQDEAMTELPEVVAGMGDVERAVDVAGVDVTTPAGDETGGDAAQPTATARLTWSWTVGRQVWTYDTTVALAHETDGWTVDWNRDLVEPSLGHTEVLRLATTAADRGDILGDDDQVLVTEREVRRFGLDKSRLGAGQVAGSARALARLVDVEVASYVDRAKAAGGKAFVEAITYRLDEVPPRVAQGISGIPGAHVVQERFPLGPSSTFAAPLLGRVGEVTAEIIDANPGVYAVGDRAGLSGLQSRYDEQLRGTPGVTVRAVASDGRTRDVFVDEAEAGEPLRTTLDERFQRAAEQALADLRPASAVVAVRPSDGAVLAAASGPGANGVNLATYGQAAPGSTFKIASALAVLRTGATPRTTVSCPTRVVVDGKAFTNYSDYPTAYVGRIPLWRAVASSCNTAFIGERDRIGDAGLAEAAASLGFGVDHDLGFPAYFGQVPPPAGATEAAADLIGQGKVLASPMAVATMMASVVAGETVVPWLVDVETAERGVPDGVPPLTPAEAGDLRDMLRRVVTDGSGVGLADIPGPPVLAKTGTAEFDDDGTLRTHAWMVAGRGDLAVAVFVDVGESGSRTAGPVLEAFLRAVG